MDYVNFAHLLLLLSINKKYIINHLIILWGIFVCNLKNTLLQYVLFLSIKLQNLINLFHIMSSYSFELPIYININFDFFI